MKSGICSTCRKETQIYHNGYCLKCNKIHVYAWRKRNKKKVKIYRKKEAQKAKDNLHDNYIKKILTQNTDLSCKNIPQELILTKRLQLAFLREIRRTTCLK